MWNTELGRSSVKPRGVLEQQLGPTSLPSTDYAQSYSAQLDAAGTGKLQPALPKGQSIFIRNNPHPCRVRHFKGLCDVPICSVQDGRTEGHRVLMSAPSGDQGLNRYKHGLEGSTRYSANGTKMVPAVGIVPITYAWRDELEKLAQSILEKASSGHSRSSSRTSGQDHALRRFYGDIDEHKILVLLCRILQTSSIPVVQAWLRHASDSEKDIVLNMLHMAASGELSMGGQQSRASGKLSGQSSSLPQSSNPGGRPAPRATSKLGSEKRLFYEPDDERIDSWLSTPSPVPLDESAITQLASSGQSHSRHRADLAQQGQQSRQRARDGQRNRSASESQTGVLRNLAVSKEAKNWVSARNQQRSRSFSAPRVSSPKRMWSAEMSQI